MPGGPRNFLRKNNLKVYLGPTLSIDFCCGMNLDMVDHRIFNKGDFSTNATIFIKKYLNLNLTLNFAIGQPKNI